MNPGDFVEARRRLESKARSGGEKLTSLSGAAGWVKDGHLVAIGGCCYSRTPLALLMEVLRQGRRLVLRLLAYTSRVRLLFRSMEATARVMTPTM